MSDGCAAYRCQGRVSLTRRFIVQRSHPWPLHPPQRLRSRHLESALIKGKWSHGRRDGLMALACWDNNHLCCTKPQLEVEENCLQAIYKEQLRNKTQCQMGLWKPVWESVPFFFFLERNRRYSHWLHLFLEQGEGEKRGIYRKKM